MIYEVLRGVPGVSVRHLGNPAYWTYISTFMEEIKTQEKALLSAQKIKDFMVK